MGTSLGVGGQPASSHEGAGPTAPPRV
jgi:hypothetical protein